MSTPARTAGCTTSFSMSAAALLALFCLWRPALAPAQAPADFHVNSVADKVDAKPGDGVCSTGETIDGHTAECTLRAAIDEVDALSAANPTRMYVISVMPGTYSLTTSENCIFRNNGNPNFSSTTTAVLCVSGNMTLNGADQTTTIVDHALADRDFFVSAGYNVVISNMTVQDGGQYGGSYNGGGGGVNNQGNLTLSNDKFFRNHSDVGGAGVDNSGTLVVEGCTFLANSGPGLQANYSTTSIDNSYFTQNTAQNGSAISVADGTLHLSNSTVSANIVGVGGIISSYSATMTITNSTISQNTIGNAGAVTSSGLGNSLTLNNVTIAGNTAGNSIGGLFADSATMSNTILAGNTGFDCTVDSLTDLGHNLVQTPEPGICGLSSASPLTGVDAKLGTVDLDGGLVPTQDPLPGSPAIGAGSPAAPGSNAAGACTAIDQRGFVRGLGGACTIGAVEPLGGLAINNVSPNVGSPGGMAWVVVHGSGFAPGSTLAVRGGGQSLPVLQTTVAPDALSITGSLDLSKAALGSYDVVVTTPAGGTTTLAAAYTVGKAASPLLYSYVYGPGVAHAGRAAYFSIVYGNFGNADAYLVPLTLSIPGGYYGLISSPILNSPAASGQVIQDWTYVPLEVGPYSTSGFSNVPLIIPVIPAGSSGVLQFSVTPSPEAAEGSKFTMRANVGTPYSTANDGAIDATALASFVSGAQDYAQANLGVTLTAGQLAAMSTYATAQFAQVVALGGQALLESAAGSPVLFSNSQLVLDTATYGASLASGAAKAESSLRKGVQPLNVSTTAAGLHPDGAGGAVPPPVSNPCTGAVMAPGSSCNATGYPVPTPDPDGPPKPFTPAQCRDLPGYHVSADGTMCVEDPHSGCSPTPVTFGPPQCNSFPIVVSIDPNEKDGPLGIGSAHFTLADLPFHYQVEFENTPTATAAAQTVSVTDPLDTSQYDLSTFELGPISFGPYVLTPPPGLTSYSSALDLRPAENVIVAISAKLDAGTGVASWNFTSLDPATMQLVTDPTAGFLPPDANPPAGLGHVAFSVKPLASVASGAKICNTATVVFDTNPAILTAPFCNSKDTTAPVSSVQALPATEATPTFPVSWSGTDAGVGVAEYAVYVSVDGGAFSVWQNETANTSASYTGAAGHTYGFYSIATDQLGNTEGAKTKAEATTTVSTGLPAMSPVFSPGGGVYNSALTVAISDTTTAAKIYYTTNGSTPTTQSTAYTVPVSVTGTETLKAIAVAPAYAESAVTSAKYTITPASVAAPSFSPKGGTFTSAQTVMLSDTAKGATIYYTTDGTTPGMASTVYSTPIHVTSTETIKAIAVVSVTSSPVASATYTIASAQCTTIDFSKGFAAGTLNLNGSAKVSGEALQLTDGKTFEAASAYFAQRVPVAAFDTDFTFQLTDAKADGFTFIIQKSGPQALGAVGGSLGYKGIPESVALKFDLFNNSGEGTDSTGVYLNGVQPAEPSIPMNASGINLHGGHVFEAHIHYDGQSATMTLQDTATKTTFSKQFQGELAPFLGTDAAYVGFTAGTGGDTAIQSILSWTFSGGSGCATMDIRSRAQAGGQPATASVHSPIEE